MTADTTHPPRVDRRLMGILVLTLLVVAAYGTRSVWFGALQSTVAYLKNETPSSFRGSDDHLQENRGDHVQSAAGHVAHDAGSSGQTPDSIQLTPEAWSNIGLVTGVVQTSAFARTVRVPGIVVERPGRSLIKVPAPVTGVVTKVLAVERDPVSPGQPLFELRLTHEDVVTAQTNFLEHLHHKAASLVELQRLKSIGSEIIAGKRIVEQQYKYDEENEKVDSLRQSLLMHGLLEEQVALIESSRELLRSVSVVAPPFAESVNRKNHFYHLQSLDVSRGEIVEAGHALATLANHSLLYVEGQAFEDDVERLFRAAAEHEKMKVVLTAAVKRSNESLELNIHSVSDRIDAVSRAFKFYLLLPNEKIVRTGEDGKFIGWKYRPGQRVEALLKTEETYDDQFVLPAEAVVIDGPNAFVFEQNGDHFDRVEVSVLYRDNETVVVKKDGRLMGSVIAMSAAFEIHLAINNAAGGPLDPHAGHSH